MSKFSEQTLDGWSKPASQSEEQRISNAISMIKDAINANEFLRPLSTEFVVQGSYANNTNVKLDSDIDICVMLKSTFFTNYPEGVSDEEYGFTSGSVAFSEYRRAVIRAVIDKFGEEHVTVGNKSIKINSNSYRVQADVVPAFQYRDYQHDQSNDPGNFVEGIKFYSSQGEEVINFPKQHIANGKEKNNSTSRRYKRSVRLFKRVRNKMKEDEVAVPSGITSFLLESLLYNIPDEIFTRYSPWNDLTRNLIGYLYQNREKWEKYVEVSGRFYLFHTGRNWTKEDVETFLVQMWNYLDY